MIFNKFWQRHKRIIFILFLFALPLLPLVFFRVRLPRIEIYDSINAAIVLPAAEALQNAGQGINVLWKNYINLVHASQDNTNLKKENLTLQQQILELHEAQDENLRLQRLLQIPELPKFPHLIGKIIGQDTNFENLSFFINIGSKQGVKVRMPVINSDGIVGTVTRVYRNSSSFVTILDPSHDVDGIVTRSRARMIVEGKGKPLVARLKYLDRSEDVRVGDRIITSGLDGVFPKGLNVGSIVRVDRPQAGVVQEAELRAAFDMGHLEEVMVLQYEGSVEKTEDIMSPASAVSDAGPSS